MKFNIILNKIYIVIKKLYSETKKKHPLSKRTLGKKYKFQDLTSQQITPN